MLADPGVDHPHRPREVKGLAAATMSASSESGRVGLDSCDFPLDEDVMETWAQSSESTARFSVRVDLLLTSPIWFTIIYWTSPKIPSSTNRGDVAARGTEARNPIPSFDQR